MIPEPIFKDIKSKLVEVQKKLPFLIQLTKAQQKRAFKMNHKRFSFVSITIESSKTEPLIVPTFVDAEKMETNFVLSTQLFEIEAMLQGLLSEINDTRILVGSEALKSATDIYSYTQQAKNKVAGLVAIYEKLKAAFPGRGKAKGNE